MKSDRWPDWKKNVLAEAWQRGDTPQAIALMLKEPVDEIDRQRRKMKLPDRRVERIKLPVQISGSVRIVERLNRLRQRQVAAVIVDPADAARMAIEVLFDMRGDASRQILLGIIRDVQTARSDVVHADDAPVAQPVAVVSTVASVPSPQPADERRSVVDAAMMAALLPPAITRPIAPPRACQWPLGDPKSRKRGGFSFCGQACVTGRPYCEDHVGVAFNRRPTESERTATRMPRA